MVSAQVSSSAVTRSNPVIVSDRRVRKIEQFCKSSKLAFEVVPDTLKLASESIRRIVASGNHSSVMIASELPSYRWTLRYAGERSARTAVSDLPYMLSEEGVLNVPVCRLPRNPNHAISHIYRMFQPPQAGKIPKVTIIYGLPENADPRLARLAKIGLKKNPERTKLALYRYARTLVGAERPRTAWDDEKDVDSNLKSLLDYVENGVANNPAYVLGIACGAIGTCVHKLQSLGISVLAIPEIPNPGAKEDEESTEEIAHISASSAISTLGMLSAIHGSGRLLVQKNGAHILSDEQIRLINFENYPLLWFEGCNSGSIPISTAVLRAGGACVGNTNRSYSQGIYMEPDGTMTSPDLDILLALTESQTLGGAHLEILQDYIAETKNKYPDSGTGSFIEQVMNLENLVLSIDEIGHREAIRLLNRSQFWGNCEAPSGLWLAGQR